MSVQAITTYRKIKELVQKHLFAEKSVTLDEYLNGVSNKINIIINDVDVANV